MAWKLHIFYMIVRVSFCTGSGMLASGHVLALPLDNNIIADTQFDVSTKSSNFLDHDWSTELLSNDTNGERIMISRALGCRGGSSRRRFSKFPISGVVIDRSAKWCR